MKNSEAWFWQTTAFLQYQETYRPALRTVPKHLYFHREKQPVAICPLAVEETQGAVKVFSLGGDPLPAPVVSDDLAPKDRERLFQEIFETVDNLAREEGVAKVSFREWALNRRVLSCSVAPVNRFVRFGYLDTTIQTHVLPLKAGEPQIWTGVRKSYHSLIQQASKKLRFLFLDNTSITSDHFRTYAELHHKAAGRVTRPESTFRMMLEWIQKGEAVLSQALIDEKTIGSIFFGLYKNMAYYWSACNDPEWEKQFAIGHFLQWKTIQEFIRRGVEYYELGWQFYTPQLHYIPSMKEINISQFKRGFGGITVPCFQGDKYYSKQFLQQERGSRLDQIVIS